MCRRDVPWSTLSVLTEGANAQAYQVLLADGMTRPMSPSRLASEFRQNGYCLISDAIAPETVNDLRRACDTMVADPRRAEKRQGRHKIDVGDKRLFLSHRHEEFPAVEAFLMAGPAAELARTLLGPRPYLFNEQFVFKAAGAGSSFAWHQDSGYVGFDHPPYLTLWCALDDATLDNGCIHVLPRDLANETEVNAHVWDEAGKELVGYDSDRPGVAVPCEAGSIIAFSSVTLHRSGSNATERPRRAYVCQYSAAPILRPETGVPLNYAKPLPASA